jgi:hypothetical protein
MTDGVSSLVRYVHLTLVSPTTSSVQANKPPGIQPREFPPDYDLSTCTHRHEILATAVEADDDLPVNVRLYHWRPPTVSVITTIFLSPAALSTTKGFTFLGTFFLADDLLDTPNTLSDLLAVAAAPPSSSSDPAPTLQQVLRDVVAQLTVPDEEGGTFVQFFSFPVYTPNPDQLLGDDATPLSPVWKWVKPDSVYDRKAGLWEAELGDALEHGEWTAGRELTVLVRGVSEETRRAVAAGDRRFMQLGGVLGTG